MSIFRSLTSRQPGVIGAFRATRAQTHMLTTSAGLSNIVKSWQFSETPDVKKLQTALALTVARHEILRTSFRKEQGQLCQIVHKDLALKIAVVDLRSLAEQDKPARWEAILSDAQSTGFDPAKPGAFRAALVNLSDTDHRLVLSAHPAVADFASLDILARELTALAYSPIPSADRLPSPKAQLADYAEWESNTRAQADSFNESQPVNPTVATVKVMLSADFDTLLRDAARFKNTTAFALAATATAYVLRKELSQPDISLTIPASLRVLVETTSMIGPLTGWSTLPISIPSDKPFSEHLQQTLPLILQSLNTPETGGTSTATASFALLQKPVDQPYLTEFTLADPFSVSGGNLSVCIRPEGESWALNISSGNKLTSADDLEKLATAISNGLQRACGSEDFTAVPLAISSDPFKEVQTRRTSQKSADPLDVPDPVSGLIEIWKELLSLSDVPTDVRFFDLGGHSLAAVRLVARIRKTWNIKMGVVAVYEHQTIDQLAAFIEGHFDRPVSEAASDWRIETLHTEGDGIPVIGVNDVGIVLSATRHFSQERPSMCVRLFDGTRGIDQSDRTFEEIALEYAKVIKSAQPKGPYILFGVCVHGNIALEAARHLQEQGEDIAAVVMKDVWEPEYANGLQDNWYTRTREKFFSLGNRIRLVRKKQMSVSALLGTYGIVRRSGILHAAHRFGIIDRVKSTDLTAEQEGFVEYISQARNVYQPKPFDAPVLHIVTDITPQGSWFMPSVGWEKVATNLKTINIDDISFFNGKDIGTADLAHEIEAFVAENAS